MGGADIHEYKFNMINGKIIEIESEHHIQSMDVVNFNGAALLYFDDAVTGINLMAVKDTMLDGQTYKMQGYRV